MHNRLSLPMQSEALILGIIYYELSVTIKGSNGKKEKLVVFAGPEQIVYEGEKVQLQGFCNLDE